MASRAERRAVCALVMCQCCKESMLSQGASKSLERLLERLSKALDDAFAEWRVIGPKEVEKIHKTIVEFDQQTFNRQHIVAPVHTSVMLGLIDPIKRATKGRRAEAAAQVERALKSVHRYYDRKLDREQDYQCAAQFLETWDQVLKKQNY